MVSVIAFCFIEIDNYKKHIYVKGILKCRRDDSRYYITGFMISLSNVFIMNRTVQIIMLIIWAVLYFGTRIVLNNKVKYKNVD